MTVLAACGKDEKAGGEAPKEQKKAGVEKQETPEEDDEVADDTGESEAEPEEESASTDETAQTDDEVLNPYVAEGSEGDVEVIYTNKSPGYNHDMNGLKVSIDEYQILKVTDMNQRFASIPFDDQTDGYVITAKVTVDNQTGKAVYYNNTHHLQLSSSSFDNIPSKNRDLISEDDRVQSKVETEISKFAEGEKVEGIINFFLTNEKFDMLKAVKPKYVIEGGAADNKEYKDSFRGEAVFDFIYSDDQKAKAESEAHFYPDKLTTDNMADKEMIFEKADINETQQIDDVKVTLEGVQYAEITPTLSAKQKFRNFGDNGIVAVTVKFKIDNQSNDPLDLVLLTSKLILDDNRGSVLSDGLAEPSTPMDIKAGEQDEKYHVFFFRKDEFELIKKFDLEFGPFKDTDGKRLFKEKTLKFTLPR